MKIINIKKIDPVGISHNPEIKKRVLISNGEVPQLTTFGQAAFKPGQSVDLHSHPTMFEIFFIQSGKAVFTVNGTDYTVTANQCIIINPGEEHAQSNPSTEEVTWLYFGIATD